MTISPDELRLAGALILNGLVLAASWQFCRRWVREDWIQRAADTLLLWFAVQYVSVGLPGLAGFLSPWTIAAVALAISAGLWWGGGAMEMGTSTISKAESWLPVGCLVFLLSYLVVLVGKYAYLPVMSVDALIYHLPAAVQWLQHGRIDLFETWFHPANAYSPLGGSVFMAWWFAPLGSDLLARFAQIPPLILIFLCLTQIGRALGARTGAAALIALGAVLSRSFISESTLLKDDLFLAAFFLAAVGGLVPTRLRQRIGPWRIGIALGLALSIKYTAMFSLPLILLMIDAPWRAWRASAPAPQAPEMVGDRRLPYGAWAIAAALVLILAGPWYLRNWLTRGNPLFPIDVSLGKWTIFHGLISITRSDKLASLAGLRDVLTAGYHSPPIWLALFLVAGWIAAVVRGARRLLADPLVRICLLGPPLGLLLFIWRGMYPEIRFIYPSLLLLFACMCIAVRSPNRPAWIEYAAAGVIALAGTASGFKPDLLGQMLGTAAIIAAVIMAMIILQMKTLRLGRRGLLSSSAAAAAILAMLIYVQWGAYIAECRANACEAWAAPYGKALAEGWTFARDQLADGVLAVANSDLVYPLQGFRGDRRVISVCAGRDIADFAHLPRLGDHMTGSDLDARTAALMQENPDDAAWLQRLRASGAMYLFIAKGSGGINPAPIELKFVEQYPRAFGKIYENEAASIYVVGLGGA